MMNGNSTVSSDIRLTQPTGARLTELNPTVRTFDQNPTWATDELRDKFNGFVAGTFFKAMLEAMRKTVGKNPLIHGGRAEEIFRGQLDNTLTERLAHSGGDGFADKLYEQFVRQNASPTSPEEAPVHGSAIGINNQRSSDLGRVADHHF